MDPGELRNLEEAAKNMLGAKAPPGKRNVFISFAIEDLNPVNLLRGQARNEATGIEFNDWSVREPFDSEQAEYIKRGIRERIRQSSVTLVYLSDNSAQSKWVDWEIRESLAMGKGVVAVYQGAAPPAGMPPALREHLIPVVRWDWAQLPRAIEQAGKGSG